MGEIRQYQETEDFGLYTTNEYGEDRKKVEGAEVVVLPELDIDAVGQIRNYAKVKIEFGGTREALDLMQSGANHILVRAAEHYIVDGKDEFNGAEHFLCVDMENCTFFPGTVEREKRARASVTVPVRDYVLLYDGKMVLHAREDGGDF